jgi:hypothetical protein
LNVDVTDFYGQSIQITLFNSVGQQVIQNTMQEVQESINELNVSRLDAGVYHLIVSDGKQQITKRVVVAKK